MLSLWKKKQNKKFETWLMHSSVVRMVACWCESIIWDWGSYPMCSTGDKSCNILWWIIIRNRRLEVWGPMAYHNIFNTHTGPRTPLNCCHTGPSVSLLSHTLIFVCALTDCKLILLSLWMVAWIICHNNPYVW